MQPSKTCKSMQHKMPPPSLSERLKRLNENRCCFNCYKFCAHFSFDFLFLTRWRRTVFLFLLFFRKREVCSHWKIRNNPRVIRFSQFPFYFNFLVQQWHLRIVRKNEMTWQQPGLVTLITSMTRALTFPDSAFYISLIFNFVPRLMKPSVKIRSPRFRRFDSRDTFNTIEPRVPGILRIFIQHRCE